MKKNISTVIFAAFSICFLLFAFARNTQYEQQLKLAQENHQRAEMYRMEAEKNRAESKKNEMMANEEAKKVKNLEAKLKDCKKRK
mgnify:CR=1 FL=1